MTLERAYSSSFASVVGWLMVAAAAVAGTPGTWAVIVELSSTRNLGVGVMWLFLVQPAVSVIALIGSALVLGFTRDGMRGLALPVLGAVNGWIGLAYIGFLFHNHGC